MSPPAPTPDLEEPRPALPAVVEAEDGAGAADLAAWAASECTAIAESLRRSGAVLFRGFAVRRAADLERFVEALGLQAVEYRDRATPRTRVQGNVYTATSYPSDHRIPLHNEGSFAHRWPTRLAFCCVEPARRGGETPLADVQRVLQRISAETRQRFERKQVLYVRNFGGKLGLSWQEVFQTPDRKAMESYCRDNGIDFEWIGPDRLRVRQVRPAIARHPETGEEVWFNHAVALHVTSLEPPARRDAVRRMFAAEDLPNNTYYGDGTSIEPDVLDELRACYEAETATFAWEAGDVLLLDNLRTAHGRMPHEGSREVLVAMADPRTWDDVGR